jgi:hypothetical protein
VSGEEFLITSLELEPFSPDDAGLMTPHQGTGKEGSQGEVASS